MITSVRARGVALRPAVLIGLDGSPSSWAALSWGADEAMRTHRMLVLAHAGPDAFGRQLFVDAVAQLVEDGVDVPVQAIRRGADPVRLLLDLGERAELTVLGHCGRPGPMQLGTGVGSVSRQVLRHTPHPLVVVGDEMRRPGAVVVGVSDTAAGRAALAFALAEAVRRGSEVHAVRSWGNHAWRIAGGTAPDLLRQQEETVLERLVQPARHAYPTLIVRAHLDPAPVEVALERAALEAAVLVLGCRRTPDHLLAPPGPVAAWALDTLPCPVAIVPEPVLSAAMADRYEPVPARGA